MRIKPLLLRVVAGQLILLDADIIWLPPLIISTLFSDILESFRRGCCLAAASD